MDIASKLIEEMQRLKAVEVLSRDQVPDVYNLVYSVTNGPHILHVGMGLPNRLISLLPGSRGSGHQSALVVMLSLALHGDNFRYFALPVESEREAKRIEANLHRRFGETVIDATRYGKLRAERVLVDEFLRRFSLSKEHKIAQILQNHCEGNINAVTAIHNDYWLRNMYARFAESYFRWKWLSRYKRSG